MVFWLSGSKSWTQWTQEGRPLGPFIGLLKITVSLGQFCSQKPAVISHWSSIWLPLFISVRQGGGLDSVQMADSIPRAFTNSFEITVVPKFTILQLCVGNVICWLDFK